MNSTIIPKRIVQTGPNKMQPLKTRVMTSTVQRLHPDFDYDFYDNQRVEQFIDEYFPQYRSLFQDYQFPIQRYDLFRYLVIFQFGGFYFDLDVLLAESVHALLEQKCIFPFEGLTLSHYLADDLRMNWEIGNYGFGSAPGHPFLKAVIDNCVKAASDHQWARAMMRGTPAFARDQYWILNTTGPGLLSRTLAERPDLTDDVTVLIPESIYDTSTWNCFGSFGVHLMSGSWRPQTTRVRRWLARSSETSRQEQVLKKKEQIEDTRSACRTITWKAEHGFMINALEPRPLVSILIPAFNAQETVSHTLRSALNQTWKNIETIIVDDGSADATVKIAESFRSKGVKVFHQDRGGAAAARNKALSHASGDYIQWLDADDLLAPNKILLQIQALPDQRKRTLLSSAWGSFLHRTSHAQFAPSGLWQNLKPVEWLFCKMDQNVYMQTGSWLVTRELTEAAGPWDTRLLSDDDGEYFCRVLLASDGVHFVPGAKIYYRSPGMAFGGLSCVGLSDRKLEAHWLSMKLHIDYLRSLEDSERVHRACINFLQASMLYFYPERSDIVEQSQRLAAELGGSVYPPNLSWKYSWIKELFGWKCAKRGRELLLKARWSMTRRVDRFLSSLSRRGLVED